MVIGCMYTFWKGSVDVFLIHKCRAANIVTSFSWTPTDVPAEFSLIGKYTWNSIKLVTH